MNKNMKDTLEKMKAQEYEVQYQFDIFELLELQEIDKYISDLIPTNQEIEYKILLCSIFNEKKHYLLRKRY
jgi:hypothetical protein